MVALTAFPETLLRLVPLGRRKSSDEQGEPPGFWVWFPWCGTLLVIGLLALAMWDHIWPDGEPLLLLNGISTWPSEFRRLTVTLFAIAAIVRCHRRLEANRKEIKETFCVDLGVLRP